MPEEAKSRQRAMSEALKNKVLKALTALASLIDAADLNVAANQGYNDEENAVLFELQLERVHGEVKIVAAYLDDLRRTDDLWVEFIRKLPQEERAVETQNYKNFAA